MDGNRKIVVTTSWDDGHPLDLRLAELLASYGVKGTFYVPVGYPVIPRMTRRQILDLRAMGMEIGSHTMTHPRMPRLPDELALHELVESKAYLEDLLSEPVPAFCYPQGKFSQRQLPLLRKAGYKLARTTMGFRNDAGFDPLLMPVSFQFWRHPRNILLRHELMQGNFTGASEWLRRWRAAKDLTALTEAMLHHIANAGGVLHIWGHSWEIENGNLWEELEQSLKLIAASNFKCATNSETIQSSHSCLVHA